MSNSISEEKESHLEFIDFLFTGSIGVGTLPEILGGDFNGILSESWVTQGQMPLSPDLFYIASLILGVLTLSLSWYGYHDVMRRMKIRFEDLNGMFRFIIDISLVLLYAVILIKFKMFKVILAILVLIFILYFIWDIFICCYKKKKGELTGEIIRGAGVTLFWLVCFVILWFLTFHINFLGLWCSLTLSILSVVLYRIHKRIKIFYIF